MAGGRGGGPGRGLAEWREGIARRRRGGGCRGAAAMEVVEARRRREKRETVGERRWKKVYGENGGWGNITFRLRRLQFVGRRGLTIPRASSILVQSSKY